MPSFTAPVACFALAVALAALATLPVFADVDAPESLPAEAVSLIARSYSTSPELKRAAEGFAFAEIHAWRQAAITGTYSQGSANNAANAQMCLSARMERFGTDMKDGQIIKFVDALASTRELRKAHKAYSAVQSGNPLIVSIDEASTCAAAGIK